MQNLYLKVSFVAVTENRTRLDKNYTLMTDAARSSKTSIDITMSDDATLQNTGRASV
jgi:hypothetical protein